MSRLEYHVGMSRYAEESDFDDNNEVRRLRQLNCLKYVLHHVADSFVYLICRDKFDSFNLGEWLVCEGWSSQQDRYKRILKSEFAGCDPEFFLDPDTLTEYELSKRFNPNHEDERYAQLYRISPSSITFRTEADQTIYQHLRR